MRKSIAVLSMILSSNSLCEMLSHKDVVEICLKSCTKVVKGKCVSRGYKDCNLVSSIIKRESDYDSQAFNPEASSSYGLMQIQCATAKNVGLKYSCEQLFSPTINIRFGILYLLNIESKLVNPTTEDILSAYNAGLKVTKIKNKKIYDVIRCKNHNIFKWNNSYQTTCYPGEYINQEYVWHTIRYYIFLSGNMR